MANVLLQAMSWRKQHYVLSVNNREELETSWKTMAIARVHIVFYIWYLTMKIYHIFTFLHEALNIVRNNFFLKQ